MQVVWGSTTFTAGACRFAVKQAAVMDATQTPYMYEFDIEVTGRLYGAGDVILSALEVAMRTALARPKQDFGVLRTDGGRSGSYWLNALTIGGNVVTNLNFGGTTAAEYVLYREFSFNVRNRVAIANATNAILEYKETVEYDGGEPEFVFKRAINARPQKQLVWFNTEYRVTQSGRAVGFRGYPGPGRKLFPGDQMSAPKIVRESPERHGANYINYPISWVYQFASASPLVATPNPFVS